MDEKMLKTTWKQRLIITAIAVVLLGSSLAVYVAVIMGSNKSSDSILDQITAEYNAKEVEIGQALSGTYFDELKSYRSEIHAFNQASANESGIQIRDIKEGDGAEITADFNDYYAYYIGYCPNETIFDSSFDVADAPTALKTPLQVKELSLIEGWTTGMLGAKVGGVRELTIPSSLAYGEQEISVCGSGAMPLRFIVMTVDLSGNEEAQKLYQELGEIYNRYLEAYYEAYASQINAAAATTDSADLDTTTEAAE